MFWRLDLQSPCHGVLACKRRPWTLSSRSFGNGPKPKSAQRPDLVPSSEHGLIRISERLKEMQPLTRQLGVSVDSRATRPSGRGPPHKSSVSYSNQISTDAPGLALE